MSRIRRFAASAQTLPVEANATNFPALKHYFTCREATGATTVKDAITGGTLTCLTAVTANGNGSISFGAITGTIAWAALTGAVVVFYMATRGASASTIRIGGATLSRVSINVAGGSGVARDGSNAAVTSGGLSEVAGETWLQGVMFTTADAASEVTSFQIDATLAFDQNAATAGTVANFTPTADGASCNSIDATDFAVFGYQLWHFAAAPTWAQIEAAAIWTYTEWAAGRKGAYPGWLGVS